MGRINIVLRDCFLILFAVITILSGCNRCRYGCENGICIKGTCTCEEYWEGDACERNKFAQYAGTYTGKDNCEGFTDSVSLSILGQQNKMQWNRGLTLEFKGESKFIISEQSYLGNMVSGEGQMLLEAISISYSYQDSTGLVNCLIRADKD